MKVLFDSKNDLALVSCFGFTLTVKNIWPPQKFIFLLLKVLFLMKLVKHHNVFFIILNRSFPEPHKIQMNSNKHKKTFDSSK